MEDPLNGTAAQPLRSYSSFMGTAAEKLQLVFRQLAALTAGCRITALDLCLDDFCEDDEGYHPCGIKGQGAERLAGVPAQCPALAYLDLSYNDIEAVGKGRLRASWRGQASGLVL